MSEENAEVELHSERPRGPSPVDPEIARIDGEEKRRSNLTKAGNPKASKEETERRVMEAAQMLAAGEQSWVVTEYMVKAYQITVRTGQWYITRARKEVLRPATDSAREDLVAEAITHRQELLARARYDGNLKLELAILDSMARLLGIDAPIKVEHSGDITTNKTDPQTLQRLQQLREMTDAEVIEDDPRELKKNLPLEEQNYRRVKQFEVEAEPVVDVEAEEL